MSGGMPVAPSPSTVMGGVGAMALRRLKEPSTWAGSSVIGLLAAQYFGPEIGGHVLEIGAAVGAILSILVPEKRAS